MKIELCPNPLRDREYVYTRRVASLLRDLGTELWCAADMPAMDGVISCSCDKPDMLLVLGGDGSIMRVAKRAAEQDVPILGINLGRVGYLAEICVDELAMLEAVLRGDYLIEHRMMLDVAVKRQVDVLFAGRNALNDAVISHGRVSRLLETEVLCDGNSLGQYHSDGFIVTTPTGSTAYSLSAGGPILDPSLGGIGLTPICPHSLTARPIIVPETSVIEIRYLSADRETAHLTVDGMETAELIPDDTVVIRRSEQTTKLVRLMRGRQKSFYDILREKMSDI